MDGARPGRRWTCGWESAPRAPAAHCAMIPGSPVDADAMVPREAQAHVTVPLSTARCGVREMLRPGVDDLT